VGKELLEVASSARKRLWILTPFVTVGGIQPLLDARTRGVEVRLITRLNDRDAITGALDYRALATLVAGRVNVRYWGSELHAKLWLVDGSACFGSANLTRQAFERNIEGFALLGPAAWSQHENAADKWFSDLWDRAGEEKSPNELEQLATSLDYHPARLAARLLDHRADLLDHSGMPQAPIVGSSEVSRTIAGAGVHQTLLVCGGLSHDRSRWDEPAGSVWANYHAVWSFSGGPNVPQVRAGQRLMLSLFAVRPDGHNDRVVIGRALVSDEFPPMSRLPDWVSVYPYLNEIGRQLVPRWPRLAMLRDVQVVDGTIGNGVYFNSLLDDHGQSIIRAHHMTPNWLTKRQEDALDGALVAKFLQHGEVVVERPPFTWWCDYIADPHYYITRDMVSRSINARTT
jgi:hypothetical protein